jgi:hypothetical protein
MLPAIRDWTLSLSQKLDRTFGNNEAVKAALVANLSYYHDDPATTWWVFFAAAQGSYLERWPLCAGRVAAPLQRAAAPSSRWRRSSCAEPQAPSALTLMDASQT